MARLLPWVFGMFCINFRPKNDEKVEEFEKSVLLMQQLLNAFSVMISALMTRKKVDYTILDKKIKIFLTTCSKFGVDVGDEFWQHKGNFYSLLNLPDQIRLYGPLRDFWDGDFEYSIQHIKPELKRLRTSMSGYFIHKLEYSRRKKCLSIVSKHFDATDKEDFVLDMINPDENLPKANWYANFYRYASIEDIKTRLESGQVLCGFYCRDVPNSVTIACGNEKNGFQFVTLKYNVEHSPVECCGLRYCNFEMVKTGHYTKEDFSMVCDGYCLLLPYVKKNIEKFQGQYTIVTDEWEVLGEKGLFTFPELSKILFRQFLSA